MKKNQEEIRNKWIFGSLVLLTLCSVIFGTAQGREQNKVWVQDYQIFKNAESTATDRNYDQAVTLFQNVLQKGHENSATINWELGKTLKLKGDDAASLRYYRKVKEVYPAVVSNQDYLQEYSEALLNTQNFTEAKKYLQELIRITTSDKYREWATEIIDYLKTLNA